MHNIKSSILVRNAFNQKQKSLFTMGLQWYRSKSFPGVCISIMTRGQFGYSRIKSFSIKYNMKGWSVKSTGVEKKLFSPWPKNLKLSNTKKDFWLCFNFISSTFSKLLTLVRFPTFGKAFDGSISTLILLKSILMNH